MADRQTHLVPDGHRFAPDDDGIQAFQDFVLARYRSAARQFPWRKIADPYAILVSEIMLQQTQVGRVAEKFPTFLSAFPDFASLSGAPLAEVLAAWQGMGYNRRAIALQKCARIVAEEHGGKLPDDPAILATFPGIGPATAASICAYAFNRPVVFIETNIRRVFIHHFFEDGATVSDDEIHPLVERALYCPDPREWYNALMDYGTDLAKSVPNPNRRSRHYAKQSAFEGSDRQIRGAVLKLLLARGTISRAAIVRELGKDRDRVEAILAALETEGFIRSTKKGLSLAS